MTPTSPRLGLHIAEPASDKNELVNANWLRPMDRRVRGIEVGENIPTWKAGQLRTWGWHLSHAGPQSEWVLVLRMRADRRSRPSLNCALPNVDVHVVR